MLRRVRDEQGAGHTRVFTLDIISHAQRIINRFTGSVTTEATLTLRPKTLVYDLTGTFTDALQVVSVKYQGEELIGAGLKFLGNVDVSWPRNIEGEPRIFSQVGLDLLIVYPVPNAPATATVTYVKDIGLIPGEDIDMSLPDHAMPMVKDFATAVLLIRQRDFVPAVKMLKGLTESFKGYRDE